jgi:hypothetical protein
MGFTIYYRSTRPISPAKAAAIKEAAHILVAGHTWLSCEPVSFFNVPDDGLLCGGSKPNFNPHPDDVASAAERGLPDGTTSDLLDILCRLSREHGVDWEIRDDYSGGPLGYVRKGIAEGQLVGQMEVLADLDLSDDGMDYPETRPGIFPPSASRRAADKTDDDDDGEPTILPFRPKGE